MRLAHLLLASFCLVGCPGGMHPPAQIETVAGNGLASFDGDGHDALESGLYAPLQVLFDRNDTPLIVDWNNHRVRSMVNLGLLTVIGTGIEGISEPNQISIAFSIHHPFQFVRTPDGQIYFAGYHDPRAFRVDQTGYVRLIAGNGSAGHSGDERDAQLAYLGSPSGIAVGADGNVYIADEAYHDIRRVDPDGIIHHFAGTSTSGYSGDGGPASDAALYAPTRLTFDGAGNLYLCDTGNHVIRRIDSNGIITTIAGIGIAGYAGDGGLAVEAMLDRPLDIVIHPSGGFLIADSKNNVIRRIDAAGEIRTIAGTGEEGFSGDGGPATLATFKVPHGVTVASDGSLWIADTYNHRIRRIEPDE